MLHQDKQEITHQTPRLPKGRNNSAGRGIPDVLALVALLLTIITLIGTALFLPPPIGDALAAADPVQWSRAATTSPYPF